MPSIDREASCDRESVSSRHQHSFSESGRLSIPMWDSSDPERAPPPLPLNPGSPSLSVRPNVSSNIQAAANRLNERARDSFGGAYTSNPSPATSPEKSLIKGAAHRRMQSANANSAKDLKSYLDGMRSSSPERSSRADDYFSSHEGTPTTPTPLPSHIDPLKDTPSLKPTARSPPKPILGENTPPSATMRALQTMAAKSLDAPLGEITNGNLRTSQSMDEVATQLSKLTAIATNLQTEMSHLSRRSKDNAADLIHLREATKTRDDDIRKNLRDLVTSPSLLGASSPNLNRSTSSFGLGLGGLLDSKAYSSPPTMPRAVSHNTIFDADRVGSPNPYSVDGAASVAMLEKIIREMVTKEGQERLLSNLSELKEKSVKENTETRQRVAELTEFVKEKSSNQALMRSEQKDRAALMFPGDGVTAGPVNPEAQKLLSKIKDSVSSNGGLTAEVKALIRELRGEILGMGRELGRKLDQVDLSTSNPQGAEDPAVSREHMHQIVQQSMNELRQHMERLIEENAQQSSGAIQLREKDNNEEMYAVVKHAIAEHSSALVPASSTSTAAKEDILQAVKQACEDFKPEIELQQFGLEREEILEVLKEGLHDYQASRDVAGASTINRAEVFGAIQDALSGLSLPQPSIDTHGLKAELLASVRECLAEFVVNFPRSQNDSESNREAINDAIKNGLAEHGDQTSRVMEISRDDLFEAVKAGLDGSSIPFGGFGEQVLQQLHELVDGMKVEFKQYSAANGRDTEQVLDAVKDGLESLRGQIESYVDRAQDVTGKDEIVDVVRTGLEQLRTDTQAYCAAGSTEGRTELLDYIRSEFEHLHEALGSQPTSRESSAVGMMSDKSDILAAINDMKSNVSSSRGFGDDSNEEILEAMKEEFDQLRDSILAGNQSHKVEILETIQESLDSIHNKVGSGIRTLDGADAEDVDSIKGELAHLRETIATVLLKSGAAADKDEILEAVREAVSGMPSQPASAGVPTEMLEAIHGEFENLKGSISQSLVPGGSRAEVEEILDTVRLGLDDLRSHVDKKLENPEKAILNGEVLDALNEGLDNLRSDVNKSLERPVDMTVNYEILDTLKEGLSGLRADMDKLSGSHSRPVTPKGGEIVLADGAADLSREVPTEAATPGPAGLKRDDLEKVEVLLAQLQIKIEAMDHTVQDLPATQTRSTDFDPATSGHAMKTDLTGMEATLAEIQTVVVALAAREKAEIENAVTKDDTDAIETLLRNTKSHLEEMILPDPESAVTKEHLDAVETAVRNGNEIIEELASKVEETIATKNDVAVVEVLAQDLKTAIDELKETMPKSTDDEEASKLTKTDLDVLGVIVTEIKTKVSEMILPDVDTLPDKAEIEQLQGLINDFRDSHDNFKETYDRDIGVTAKAFDDRRQDSETFLAQVGEIKTLVEQFREEVLAKKAEDESVEISAMEKINEALDGIQEKVGENPAMAEDLKALLETVKTEFEKAHTSLDAMKTEHSEHTSSMAEKQDEHREAIIGGIYEKVTPHFDTLTSKYEETLETAKEHARIVEERSASQEAVLTNTKEMAEELKLSIDTLGTALTTSTATFNETSEKLGEDSKTVYNRVEDVFNKLDETQTGLKGEQEAMQSAISKAVEGISGLQDDLTENHPKLLMSLMELQALVGQHYEHSQKVAEEHSQAIRGVTDAQAEGFKTHGETMNRGFSSLPALTAAPECTETATQFDDSALHEKLDKLLEQAMSRASPDAKEQLEQLMEQASGSDSAIHEKLDKLIEHNGEKASDEGTTPQLERLDQIHTQVMATAAEFSAFVAMQTERIANEHENKEKENEEIGLVLERRQAQKDHIESEITSLNDEKESLRNTVEALRAEKDTLAAQRSRLNAETSALHTALEIRREELHAMNVRADALERRILEGLMDQSRSLLLAKSAKSAKIVSPKKAKGRDLRIPSDASAATVTSTVPSLAQNHALAMKSSRPQIRRTSAVPNSAERRIMSLSQISRNVPSGGLGQSHSPAPSLIGRPDMKRSHSVKTNHSALRKSSWHTTTTGMRNFSASSMLHDGANKENSILSEESEEEEDDEQDSRPSTADTYDDASTERRTSYTNTESGLTYGTGSYGEGITPGLSDDGSFATGSYLTGSDLDRRSSLGTSAIASMVAGAVRQQIAEEDEEDDDLSGEDGAGELETPFKEGQLVLENGEREVYKHEDEPAVEEGALIEQRDFALLGGGFDGAMDDDKGRYAPPSDSGLGTDLPTAALGSEHGGYFEGMQTWETGVVEGVSR